MHLVGEVEGGADREQGATLAGDGADAGGGTSSGETSQKQSETSATEGGGDGSALGDAEEGDWRGQTDTERTKMMVREFWSHVQFQEEFAPTPASLASASAPSATDASPLESVKIDKSVFSLRSLGKRGRLYDDLWSEEDFLEAEGLLEGGSRRCVESWADLLRHYNDDHDGCYIDWLLEELMDAKKLASYAEADKVRSADASVAGTRARTALVTRSFSGGSGSARKESARLETSLLPPPVPVSTQHPACWGPGSHFPIPNNRAVPVELIHPACATSTVLGPVGQYLAPSAGRQQGGNKRRRVAEPGGGSHVVSCVDDEMDEIGLHADQMVRHLEMQSAANYVLLSRVIASARRDAAMQQLRQKQSQLQAAVMAVTACINGYRQSQLEHTMLTKIGGGGERVAKSGKSSSSFRPAQATTALPLVSGEAASNRRLAPGDFTGAVLTQHLSHGHFLHNLEPGDLVEVYGIGNVWSLSRVVGLQLDHEGVLRFVQTRSIGACDGDCQVAAVEDGTVVPSGTHVPRFLVDIALAGDIGNDKDDEYEQ
jgi:hypothetical protein